MSYPQLLILVVLASFAAVSTTLAIGIAVACCCARDCLRRLDAMQLLVLRLVPAVLGLVASDLAAVAFARYEPRGIVETPGPLLLTGAAVAAGLAVTALQRITRQYQITKRFLRTLDGTAVRITLPGMPFPVWRVESAFLLSPWSGCDGRSCWSRIDCSETFPGTSWGLIERRVRRLPRFAAAPVSVVLVDAAADRWSSHVTVDGVVADRPGRAGAPARRHRVDGQCAQK